MITLSSYQKLCYKLFSGIGKRLARGGYRLSENLERSRIGMLPSAYISYVLMNSLLALVGGLVTGILLVTFLPTLFELPALVSVLILIVFPVAPPILTCFAYISLPASKATARAKNIDAHLPYVANFISAMAAAHATPENIFKSLGKQEKIYKEVSKEATLVYRDMSHLGMDLVTALKAAVRRSPSKKFQDFLQGIISTLTSGGDLKSFFLHRAEYYMRENRRNQKDFVESLGIMGESYVVVAVASPLLVIIILVVMSWVGGVAGTATLLLFLVIFLVLPAMHAGFAGTLQMMLPKV